MPTEEEIPLSGLRRREILLGRALAPVVVNYDRAPIDRSPGVFAARALMASRGVIVPVDTSYPGLIGIRGIERAMTLAREYLNRPVEVLGVLTTR